jgi:trehalose utilization protein
MAGIGDRIELPHEEMYGEPFLVPEPMETVLISWFEGGEVFRSGLTWARGAGRIFYFRPGHETYPTYHDPVIQQVLRNAVRWAYNPAVAWRDVAEAPNVPWDKAPEPISPKGPSLHKAGEAGYR